MIPLNPEQLSNIQLIFEKLSYKQLVWISGYLYGLLNPKKESLINDIQVLSKKNIYLSDTITIVSASQTGNARRLADQLYNSIVEENLNVALFNAQDFKFKKINEITFLIIIVSTYGEGDPPEEAIPLYKYLFSQKAPSMKKSFFSIFGLGDKSYTHFAKAGKDLDSRLEELGAIRLYDRVDADVEFQVTANDWIKKIVSLLKQKISSCDTFRVSSVSKTVIDDVVLPKFCSYSKDFPLVACLSKKQKITSCNAIKDIHHLEIDISGANMYYHPGDALGVWYENDIDFVNQLLEILHFTGCEQVQVKEKVMYLSQALIKCYELTQNTAVVMKNLAIVTRHKKLLDLCRNEEEMRSFISITPILEMFRYASNMSMTPEKLLKVLRPMRPRFYSIASAQSEVGEEVHITVGLVSYCINGRFKTGDASGYLINRLQEDDEICVFIESNDNFRLPKDANTPIIMIGAGTGIAPFRAFMQQRSSDRSLGKNWLFFGNLNFIDDFLYQVEWQRYFKDGLLTKIDTAWSRDQFHKVYVQDKLLIHSVELWSWIQKEGAYVYVCGDANRMAKDVEQTLLMLTSDCGNMSLEKAHDFWNEMRVQRRYQRDIY